MEFKDRSCGYIRPNTICLDGGIIIYRLNIEQEIFLMHIIYINRNVFHQTSEVVVYDDANFRLIVLVYGGRASETMKLMFCNICWIHYTTLMAR